MSPEFIKWMKKIAKANGIEYLHVLWLWKKYSKQCDLYDQSPVESEFLDWNKLKGE